MRYKLKFWRFCLRNSTQLNSTQLSPLCAVCHVPSLNQAILCI